MSRKLWTQDLSTVVKDIPCHTKYIDFCGSRHLKFSFKTCWKNFPPPCMISGFRSEVGENCALLGYYAASIGNSLPMFKDNLSFLLLGFLTLETGTETWSRNVAAL
jgi:hypothetical protein